MTPRSSGSSSTPSGDDRVPSLLEPLPDVAYLLLVGGETLLREDVFWGVDFGCKAASIGWRSGSHRGVVTTTWDKKLRGGQRLEAAYQSIRAASDLLAMSRPAVFVYVEQPSGSFRNLELLYMCGIVQSAISGALSDYWEKPVEIRTVTSGRWKKEILGRGDYKKPGPKDDFEYEGLRWCRENEVEVDGDDESDAVCIAEYACLNVSFV